MSIFNDIYSKKLPGYVLCENDLAFSILSLHQINPGHALVIPKKEIDHFIDVPSKDYMAVMELGHKVSKAIALYSNKKRVGMMVQGIEVPHFHLHLVPFSTSDELKFSRAKVLPEQDMQDIFEGLVSKLTEVL